VQLTHSFSVPVAPAETWAAFSDIESVAECFPGAAVTSVEGDSFEGTCKVKLGPIALVYGGSGRFVERDQAAGHFVVEAKGKDKRGNGTAGATVSVTLAAEGSGTKVDVVTDLQITGKPAQFGRGVMQDVSDKLLQQFVECLQQKVSPQPQAKVEPDASTPSEPEAIQPAVDDSFDVAGAVLPVLARTYWRQAAAALASLIVVAVLIRWLRRR
jgi:carbon monoxide dehydrogenase subunit G